MKNQNIKASNYTMSDKQFKLYDLIWKFKKFIKRKRNKLIYLKSNLSN